MDFPSYRTDLAIHPLSVRLLYSILLNSPCCKYSSTIVQYLVSVIIYISNCVLSKLPNIFTVVHSNIYDPFPLIITQLCIDSPSGDIKLPTFCIGQADWSIVPFDLEQNAHRNIAIEILSILASRYWKNYITATIFSPAKVHCAVAERWA